MITRSLHNKIQNNGNSKYNEHFIANMFTAISDQKFILAEVYTVKYKTMVTPNIMNIL